MDCVKTRTYASLLAGLCLVIGGCTRPEPPQPAPVSATSCAELSERICSETSHVSPICKSLQKVLELWSPEACAAALADVPATLHKIAQKRQKCVELTDRLCADLGPENASCTMATNMSKGFTSEKCVDMLGRYAEVLQSLKSKEAAPKPALSAEQFVKLAASSASLSFGPADAKVTVVSFSDFEDPSSARASSTLQALRQKYGEQVRLVLRQFPLPFHRNAHVVAQGALEAHAQGKFWQYYDKVLDNQSQLGREKLEGYAAEVGLNMAKFKKALNDRTYAAEVDADFKLGQEVAIDKTPALFVNGTRIANPADLAAVQGVIDQALKSAS